MTTIEAIVEGARILLRDEGYARYPHGYLETLSVIAEAKYADGTGPNVDKTGKTLAFIVHHALTECENLKEL